MTQPDNLVTIKPQATSHSHNTVLVSIIIPAYNTAQYIYRAIESSLRQTHSNIEVLVIDDGSKDDTLRVAQSYAEKDGRVRVYHQENAGVSAARNHGIREAKGEYLVFLDSDDWLEDEAVEVMLATQAENPGRLVGVNFWFVSFDSSRKDILLREKQYNVRSRNLTVCETVRAQHEETFPRTSCAKIFSSDIIRRNNLKFRENIHYGEDQLFALEYLFTQEGSVYMEEPLFDILLTPNSLMRTPYSERKWHNREDWCSLLLNKPGLTPELRSTLRVYAGKTYIEGIKEAMREKLGREIIRARREKSKPFMRDILSSRRVGLMRKVYYMCLMYLPVPAANLIMSLWQKLKLHVNSTVKEVIPYW